MSEIAAKPIRSPSYPSMSLREAVDAVGKIESSYRSSAVDRTVAAKLIGYSSLSGPANKALAALAAYGLLERAGKGEARVTERARAILHASNEAERKANLIAAASEPDLFRELRERFAGIAIPPESGVVTCLNRQGFNPTAIGPAAKAFLQTMSQLEELGGSESHGPKPLAGQESDASSDGDRSKFGGAKVGDLIQWESNGALQFKKPLRVRLISEDGNWVAVEGSQTGIPMSEVIVERQSVGVSQPASFIFPEEKDEAPPSEGTDLRFKVGKNIVIKVTSPSELGADELNRLVKLLQAQSLAISE